MLSPLLRSRRIVQLHGDTIPLLPRDPSSTEAVVTFSR